ncbi:hypothetical protein [Hoyosella altamirensis]|uniref:Uncharacterized protein n=1 Tax=Hoyosella altamirensis TaxID=616997 RepID=A0A839RHS4_9ACTN|nr:hypothetical protein [Hoyosella altamirensis]MBB3035716.1 hypothetical protein [Hoyosella altamirensis]
MFTRRLPWSTPLGDALNLLLDRLDLYRDVIQHGLAGHGYVLDCLLDARERR